MIHVAPAAVTLPAPVVHVAPAAPVVVSWGDWILELAKFLAGFASMAVGFGLTLVKNPLLRMALQSYLTKDRMDELVGVAIAKVEGAAKGKTLDGRRRQFSDRDGRANGARHPASRHREDARRAEGIRDKIIAKLDLEAAASDANLAS